MTMTRSLPTAIRRRAIHHPTLGALPFAGGVRFRVWAPEAREVEVLIDRGGRRSQHVCAAEHDGLWSAAVAEAGPGDRYGYSLDRGPMRPDPFSRFQPDGVHGSSEIIDPASFTWADDSWPGLDPSQVVIYELHVGTFGTPGTFTGVAARFPELRDLGVTAVELMPLAEFGGARNWGYDGVAPFAPSHNYGRPDDLRRLVDAAHAAGLGVLIDVVYNHLGPEGAYLPTYSRRFLTHKQQTPWGGAVNLDDTGCRTVRRLLIENALHWIHEYHVDGLRLDATHSLFDSSRPHFVAELAAAVHAAAAPAPLVYAEDHRNLTTLLEPGPDGWNLDGVWADDFHHIVRRMLGGDAHGYYQDFAGDARELAAALQRGWLYIGQPSRHERAPRGTDPSAIEMRRAVICVQNHDQIGNRALGDRLHHAIAPAPYRAAISVLLLAPMTPLLFMGQEWAASSPFQFFTDFEPELGRKVVEGRRGEFKAFPEFATPEAAATIPDPQDPATFNASRLRWDERATGEHGRVLALHRALLSLRRGLASPASEATTCRARAEGDDAVVFERGADAGSRLLVVARLRGSGSLRVPELAGADITPVLDTEGPEFAADPAPAMLDPEQCTVHFARPGSLVFRLPRRPRA